MPKRPEATGRFHRKSDDAEGEASAWERRLGQAVFILAVACIAFIGGAYVVLDKAPTYQWLRQAHLAATALYYRVVYYRDPMATDAWARPRTDARGVTIHDPNKAYEGLTLYTSGHEPSAFLVDMSGKVVHRWHLPFSNVHNETSVVASPRPDAFTFMRKAHLFPNGDLLAVYISLGDTPWGLGVIKMDRNSNVIWSFQERAHHDIAVGGDGRVYVLTHAMRHDEVAHYKHLEPPVIEDFLVILSPDGTVEKKISLLDALVRSPWGRLLHSLPFYTLQDPLHTNTVKVIDAEGAANFPYGKEGDVLLSFRELGLIAVLDLKQEKLTWALRGPWLGQHDPDLLPSGNILMFDNSGEFGPGGISRVIEFDPKTGGIVWSYTGTAEKPLASIIRAGQQRLPNGNTLITESNAGRLIEVTREGEIVWEYVNPIRRQGRRFEKIPVVEWGTRIAITDLDPAFLPH